MDRKCESCGIGKPLSDFRWIKKSNGKTHPMRKCRDCHNAARREATRIMRLTVPRKKTGPKPVRFHVANKVCSRCNVDKDRSAFGPSKGTRDGLNSFCKACASENSKQWVQENRDHVKAQRKQFRDSMTPEQRRAKAIMGRCYAYGITREEYDRLFAQHGNQCALCGSTKKLCIDHDHSDGRVRGIVCSKCNLGLSFMDRPDWIAKAGAYLDRARQSV